ncbi:MAG: type II toxin-antitoxin system VapC family toxin [Dehalococcoidia bacterium]|nr:type II toxin-antitoxin system VapC family toxin [Dehalococcoidia bacterium]
MTLAVDASALVAALTDLGPEGRWARAQTARDPLVCPEVVLSEAANTLRRLEQAGGLTQEQATRAYHDLLEFDLGLRPYKPFADRIWQLRRNLTSYDAWYVAVAEALDCPLVTLDVRLSRAPGPQCAFVTPPGEGD